MSDTPAFGTAEYLREVRISSLPMTPVSQRQLDREAKAEAEALQQELDREGDRYGKKLIYDDVIEVDGSLKKYPLTIVDLFPLTGDEND
jgi:hypothetical protein